MTRSPRSLSVRTLHHARILKRPARTAKPRIETLESRDLPASPIFAVGTDAGVTGQVKVYDAATQELKFTLSPFANSFTGGVRVAVADVTGDGTADIIAAQGPGGANRVKVFNGDTGNQLGGALGSFIPFNTSQADGVFVAAGDVNGDGRADVIVGSDGTGNPRAKIVNGQNGNTIRNLNLSDLNLAGGVRVAAGDVNGDGKAEAIVGGGPGGAARVAAFDGGNGMALFDFFPFEPGYKGGINVAAGDVTGDGMADIVAGQASGGSQVKVFDSNTTSVGAVQAFTTSAGVRVGAVDANQDGKLDVMAASGTGAGQVRIFDSAGTSQLSSSNPFGANFTAGVFTAGDPTPADGGIGILSHKPEVSIALIQDAIEGDFNEVKFRITRGGDTAPAVSINLTWGGTAGPFDASTVQVALIGAGQTSVDVVSSVFDDSEFEGPETVTVTMATHSSYDIIGSPTAAGRIVDSEVPLIAPVADCGCGGTDAAPPASGILTPKSATLTSGVRAEDGTVTVKFTDLMSGGFGQTSAVERGWTNAIGYDAASFDGDGSVASQLPYLRTDGTDVIAVVQCTQAEYFDGSGGAYTTRHMSQDTLTQNTTSKEFTLITSSGAKVVFNNFDGTLPTFQKGQVKSITDANGNVTTIASRTSDGKPLEIQRTSTTGGTTTTETFLYAFISSGTNAGKVESVILQRHVGVGTPVPIRKVFYSYYTGSESAGSDHGTAGDLKLAVVKDGADNVIDSAYYRYRKTATSTGYAGSLKYAVTGDSYERLKAADSTPEDAADTLVSAFADDYLEFDNVQRVTKHVVQGTGCTACAGGLGESTFSYATSAFAEGYNSWRTKTVETRADGNTLTIYTNFVGQPILEVFKDTTSGLEWLTFHKYDTLGREVLVAQPSALSGYDETKADLLNNQSGNYQHLRDSQGLIATTSYYSSTTATSSTPGGVNGYLNQSHLQRGETGTAILQSTTQYLSRTDGSITVFPVANVTQYRNTDGTGGQTFSYAYTYFSGTIQPESITTTLPAVTTAQNGSNSANSTVVVSDERGRPIWQKDEAGFLTYTQFDDVTGGVLKIIQDVDHTQTSTFANLPSGWTTPSGGGLHRTTVFELDAFARATKITDPNGNITFVVFDDEAHETRVYPGWNTSTNLPTGPTQVYREDRDLGYTESLTMSATPNHTSGRPNGTEAISGIQSLSRSVVNSAGQVVYQDQYFDLTGVSYSDSSVTLGAAGTNYHRTELRYGKLGDLERTQTPSGTIYRTVFDGLSRPVSSWVGTDDTPTSGFWSPTNLTGTDMKAVAATVYDNDGVGDGLVTKTIEMPGTPFPNIEHAYSHDWRNRLVATKAAAEASESTSVNRPINYSEYDNLSQIIVSEMYDGDTLSITTDANSDGVPDRPSASALRAKSTASFDELGRVYQTNVFSVDPSNGTVSSNSLVSKSWFNSRGLLMKSSSPGGVVSKSEFDGLGRTTKSYMTDGGGDSAYGDADDVTGDAVLSQTELTYDANGNVIFMVSRERFHDEADTGALGTPTTGVNARVSYSASYFDKADRLTTSVDVGTNGGSAYTRPSTPDSRSDTVLVTDYGYNAAGWVESITDPKGLVNKTFYDLLGRTTKTIENYVNGVVSDVDDKTVEYTYASNGQMKTLKAYLSASTFETTEWVFGITSPIVSNDILKEMRYPDPSSGSASTTEKDAYTYNQIGQVKTFTDRNGNVHTYTYDGLGRVTEDAITTLGSGVDGAVRRIVTEYDGQGNAFRLTSFDAAMGGNVVNQVEREFDGLGNLIKEYQATNGAVNTGTTPKVQYAWSFAPSGSNNHNRLTKLTYPNGREIDFDYSGTLNDSLSRLSAIKDGATTLESFDYLGAGTVVKRGHAQPGLDLTFIKQSGESNADAGDQYTGLDRFGRIADNRWRLSGADVERRKYGHDRNSNRLYAENIVETTRSEIYTYDGFNQLTSMDRGTLNGTKDGISGSSSRSQDWDYDALGNWDSLTTDGGAAQTRGHNKQNEITSISGATTPTYDNSGNLTKDETGRTFEYDAWNRLVVVKASGGATLATYRYDALGRRVRETRGSTTTDLFYSAAWQVLEERVGTAVKFSYVWSPVYVDALIARDRDTDGNGSLDERLYAVHDANFNVVALVGLVDSSWVVVERYAYDVFGVFSVLTPAWGSRSSSNYDWKYLHQGGRWDADGSVYSFRNREYSPTLGRWLQLDPVGFATQDANHYRYCGNQSISRTDSSGLQWVGAGLEAGGIILPDPFGRGCRALGRIWNLPAPPPPPPPPVKVDPCKQYSRRVGSASSVSKITFYSLKILSRDARLFDQRAFELFEEHLSGVTVNTQQEYSAAVALAASRAGLRLIDDGARSIWALNGIDFIDDSYEQERQRLSRPGWHGADALPDCVLDQSSKTSKTVINQSGDHFVWIVTSAFRAEAHLKVVYSGELVEWTYKSR